MLKDKEWKLISELMKNSRRSDRELAKATGASQPTITRLRTKLEKEGYIKEYTIIPSFSKIGYHILAFSFLKVKTPITEKEFEELKKTIPERLAKKSCGIVMLKPCMGGPLDTVVVSFHQDYASFDNFRLALKNNSLINVIDLIAFLVNLDEENQYLPLTFSLLANDVSIKKQK